MKKALWFSVLLLFGLWACNSQSQEPQQEAAATPEQTAQKEPYVDAACRAYTC